MKSGLFLLIAGRWITFGNSQTPITLGVFGNNCNLTDTVGANSSAGGHLDEFFFRAPSGKNFIALSNMKFMRYGGIQVEKECQLDGGLTPGSNLRLTIADYVRKAKVMRADNIEPMFTLPF